MLLALIAHAAAMTILGARAVPTVRAGAIHMERDFAPQSLVSELRLELAQRRDEFQAAESVSSNGCSDDLRQAFRCRPSMGSNAFADLYDRLSVARSELSGALGCKLATGLEAAFVVYPAGGYYRRHIDSIAGVDEAGSGRRIVSFICYLTPSGWTAEDGGALRVHDNAKADGDCSYDNAKADGDCSCGSQLVLPESGSLALFDSKRVWHEVETTRRERACLVGWMLAA